LKLRGSSTRRSSIIAELMAASTVAPLGTLLPRSSSGDRAVRERHARQGRGERIEAHRFEDVASKQLVIPFAGSLLGAGKRLRPAEQLLKRLRNDHGRLRRPADDEAHERGPDLVVRKPGLALCLHAEAAAEEVVFDDASGPAALDLILNVAPQCRRDLVNLCPDGRAVVDELELEQARRPDP